VATLKSDKQRSEDLVDRLNRHPEFREKVEELLDIADNKSVMLTRRTMLRI
jgi:hypothetical protein